MATEARLQKPRSKAASAELLTARVIARRQLSQSFARITLQGEGLGKLHYQGFDQWFRMFIPVEGQEGLTLPEGFSTPGWYQEYLTCGSAKPVMRYVTIRSMRNPGTDRAELDIDVVLHGKPGDEGTGPLSNWAQTVEAGARVGLVDQGMLYRPAPAGRRLLLTGDEAGLPGIAAICEHLPADTEGQVLIEVPTDADFQELRGPISLKIDWFARQAGAGPGAGLLANLAPRAADLHGTYVYCAGEANLVLQLGDLLRNGHDWPADLLTATTYWRKA